MRLYFFNNFYISSIQQGIQAGHASDELQYKYISKPLENIVEQAEFSLTTPKHKPIFPSEKFMAQSEQVIEWQKKHKTYIVLNGGDNKQMAMLRAILESPKNPYPVAFFKEEGLGNCLTSQCILLPEYMYDESYEQFKTGTVYSRDLTGQILRNASGEPVIRPYTGHEFTEWERQFLEIKGRAVKAI